MKIKKTKFASYCLNDICEGCRFCVKGEKLVLFITGICKRNCFYCSLSEKRKNKDIIWANERKIRGIKELIEEVEESNSTSAGITGGDVLLVFNRTLEFSKALKKKFGKKFHIHIYIPTKNISAEKLGKLSKYVDEVRFHPEFLARKLNKGRLSERNRRCLRKDIEKIRLAGLFWIKNNIGIELPLLPDKKKEIFNFILKIKDYIGFVNLNELEISDTNFNFITKKYKLKQGGYAVAGSLNSGLWVLNKLKNKTKLKIHLCTAELKNRHQFLNRLKRHKILPYGKKTNEGTVIYLVVKGKINKGYYDKKKKRTILSEKTAKKLLGKHKIYRVEEYPTYDRDEVEAEEIKLK